MRKACTPCYICLQFGPNHNYNDSKMGVFPKELPADCPLPRAMPSDCEVYMLSKTLTFSSDDFRSQAERNRALNATGEGVCTRHGLSVFPTFDSCAHLRRARPALGKHILRAQLSPEHGKIADTPSNTNPRHHTWWPFEGIERELLFSVVSEEETS